MASFEHFCLKVSLSYKLAKAEKFYMKQTCGILAVFEQCRM